MSPGTVIFPLDWLRVRLCHVGVRKKMFISPLWTVTVCCYALLTTLIRAQHPQGSGNGLFYITSPRHSQVSLKACAKSNRDFCKLHLTQREQKKIRTNCDSRRKYLVTDNDNYFKLCVLLPALFIVWCSIIGYFTKFQAQRTCFICNSLFIRLWVQILIWTVENWSKIWKQVWKSFHLYEHAKMDQKWLFNGFNNYNCMFRIDIFLYGKSFWAKPFE